jgi:hypothetical protein
MQILRRLLAPQNDSADGFFRSLFSPSLAVVAASLSRHMAALSRLYIKLGAKPARMGLGKLAESYNNRAPDAAGLAEVRP